MKLNFDFRKYRSSEANQKHMRYKVGRPFNWHNTSIRNDETYRAALGSIKSLESKASGLSSRDRRTIKALRKAIADYEERQQKGG